MYVVQGIEKQCGNDRKTRHGEVRLHDEWEIRKDSVGEGGGGLEGGK